MLYDLLLRDIIEITIYSSCIFFFCIWLKTDKTKNLLGYFFMYSGLALCAWVMQLQIVTLFLFSYAPVALLLFIVLHEKTLQRNLVTLCSIIPAQRAVEDWIDTTISSCLTTINANKSITIVIERKDALDHFLEAPFLINADLSKNLFDILLSSTSYNEQKMVWVSSHGKVKGINTSWITDQETKKDTLFYTLHSDALVLSAHPINRTFSLIHNGKEIKNISAHHVRTMIKKQFSLPSSSQHKGAYREINSSKESLSL